MKTDLNELTLDELLRQGQMAYTDHLAAVEGKAAAEKREAVERDEALKQSIREGLASILPAALLPFADLSDETGYTYMRGDITVRVPNHAPFMVMGDTRSNGTKWVAYSPTDIRIPDRFDSFNGEIVEWSRVAGGDVCWVLGYCAEYYKVMQIKMAEYAVWAKQEEEAIGTAVQQAQAQMEGEEAKPMEITAVELLQQAQTQLLDRNYDGTTAYALLSIAQTLLDGPTTPTLEEAINQEISSLVETDNRCEAGPAERELFGALMDFRKKFFDKRQQATAVASPVDPFTAQEGSNGVVRHNGLEIGTATKERAHTIRTLLVDTALVEKGQVIIFAAGLMGVVTGREAADEIFVQDWQGCVHRVGASQVYVCTNSLGLDWGAVSGEGMLS